MTKPKCREKSQNRFLKTGSVTNVRMRTHPVSCFAIEVEKNKSKNKLQGFVLGLRLPVIVIIVKVLVCVSVVKAIDSHLNELLCGKVV